MPRLLISLVTALTLAGAAMAQGAGPAKDMAKPERAVAAFAGGCFWCMQSDFDKLPGEVTYDPRKLSYKQLLTYYWHHVVPTVKNRQFCDVVNQYRTVIFVRNEEQRKLAEASKKMVEAELKVPIYTQIVAADPFYKAETYHQEYYKKHPLKYKYYRWNCGRDQRVKQIWGKHKGES
jgi:peptide-methionine (S)-S-oxide reductase